jgi:hypothetical protein
MGGFHSLEGAGPSLGQARAGRVRTPGSSADSASAASRLRFSPWVAVRLAQVVWTSCFW